jgi:hypothetical protein
MKEGENMAETIQAYFFGISYGEVVNGKQIGLAGFAIPDLGIVFRSRFNGSIHECQYAGLLSLLEFIQSNKKNLSAYKFEILSDSALVVHQIAHRKFISRELTPYFETAIGYKGKIDFRVTWVPREENVAITGMAATPPYKPDLKLNFELGRPSINGIRQA